MLAVLAGFTLAAPAVFAEDAKTDKPDTYPLKTCVVSGEKLGEMGKPYVYTHEGREVRFCCKGCLKDFKKDPAKYVKKLDDAEKAANIADDGEDDRESKNHDLFPKAILSQVDKNRRDHGHGCQRPNAAAAFRDHEIESTVGRGERRSNRIYV